MPPQNSPLAFSSSTPSITACVSTGNSVDGFTRPSSSAAVAVTILNVEPGGCGAENAMPAERAHLAVARVERGHAAEAPRQRRSRPPPGGACRSSSRRRRTRAALPARARALPATSSPPGRPRSRFSKTCSRPLCPTGQSAGKPRANSAARSAARLLRLHAARRSSRRCPRAARSSTSPGPAASTLPSRERSVARTGGSAVAAEPLAGAQLGEHEPRRPARRGRPRPARAGRRGGSRTRACGRPRGTSTRPPSAPSGSPASIEVSVAVAAAPAVGAPEARERVAVCADGLSSPCIALRSPRSHAAAKSSAARSAALCVPAPTSAPATSDTAASPPSAGRARCVMRRRRSAGMLFTRRDRSRW